MTDFNIYCDESCHGQNDGHRAMVLGALQCPRSAVIRHSKALRALRAKHGIPPTRELKWTAVSRAKVAYYIDVVDYFFAQPELTFRAVVIPDKGVLQHEKYKQTHDDFYYKICFLLIEWFLDSDHCFSVALDIKDTRGARRMRKLREVLSNSQHDFDQKIVHRVQVVRSQQEELLQLADLLIGAVCAVNEGPPRTDAKMAVIARIQEKSGLRLTRTTLLGEKKVNILMWRGDSGGPHV